MGIMGGHHGWASCMGASCMGASWVDMERHVVRHPVQDDNFDTYSLPCEVGEGDGKGAHLRLC